jgi:ABC-type nitrate/sulfonate/bicarbonate transport system ATPase subunit
MTLTIERLRKTYGRGPAARTILDGIDLTVAAGECVAIVGRSGCGKSTLLRLLAGLDADYEGALLHDGAPIAGTDLRRGIVFQDHRLFPWLTLADNVGLALADLPLPPAEKRARVRERLAAFGLGDYLDAYPKSISGGMAQRVAFARSLVNRPSVLLLDEPFGALDAITRAHLQQELLALWRAEGLTVVIVTHDIEEAALLAGRVVVLDQHPGRIRRVHDVALPYPRRRGDPAFGAVHDRLMAEFQDDLARAA